MRDLLPRSHAILFALLLSAACGTAWGLDGRADLARSLERCLGRQDEAAALEVLALMREHPDPEHVRALLFAMATSPTPRVYDEARAIVVGFDPGRLDAPVRRQIETKDTPPLVVAAALDVARDIPGPIAEGWLIAGLSHSSDLIERHAIHGLRERRSKRAIPHLIDALERHGVGSGVPALEARNALVALTGHDFDSIEEWRLFWKENEATLDPARLDEEGRTGLERKKPERELPLFFGKEVVSRRVIFVVDISGSMTMWDPGGEEGGKGSSWEHRQRIVRTKRQLTATLQRLATDAHFNVIAFHDSVRRFQKQMVPATGEWKGAAAQFVSKLDANSATHTDEALEAALSDPNVDTILLLSDGAPMRTDGAKADTLIPRILKRVRHLNRLRRVLISTFGFEGRSEWPPGSKYAGQPREDPGPMVEFLKRLAAENGGTYTPIP